MLMNVVIYSSFNVRKQIIAKKSKICSFSPYGMLDVAYSFDVDVV
jgi:hypothetical protein